jgi:uncharacterized membrane protein YjjP (DUF1212 family)
VPVEDEQRLGTTRYRVYQIIGIVIGLAFLALGVAAYFFGGGPIVAAIAAAGGVLVLIVSIVNMVRS